MSQPAVVFDHVWKKFRRGERHDTMRDAIRGWVTRPFKRRNPDLLDDHEFWALQDVSFEVRAGEALGIIGPNGAGKSTALKLLTKILKPTKGRSWVRGRVGALIEVSSGFHHDLTGRENLYLQGAILGMNRDEVSRKLDAIVDFAGISDFIDTPVKRYSSGMNARLGFAVAAHIEPDVLIIDEVLAVGDAAFQQKCYQRLEEFRRGGAAIVFVSHNMQVVVSLCDRALLLRRGRPPLLSSAGAVADLYSSISENAIDSRVTVRSCKLSRRGDESAISGIVAPTTPLTLDLRIVVHAALPRTRVGFEVVRNDALVIFNGTPMTDGAPAMDLQPDQELTIRVHFVANVLRGTYRISLHLSDTNKLWDQIDVSGLASFVVHETTRIGGCAELLPEYELRMHASGRADDNTRVGV
jgi:lipopolysaccharide transport system ATP-binding protein